MVDSIIVDGHIRRFDSIWWTKKSDFQIESIERKSNDDDDDDDRFCFVVWEMID